MLRKPVVVVGVTVVLVLSRLLFFPCDSADVQSSSPLTGAAVVDGRATPQDENKALRYTEYQAVSVVLCRERVFCKESGPAPS